jgi:hypothetical protein
MCNLDPDEPPALQRALSTFLNVAGFVFFGFRIPRNTFDAFGDTRLKSAKALW